MKVSSDCLFSQCCILRMHFPSELNIITLLNYSTNLLSAECMEVTGLVFGMPQQTEQMGPPDLLLTFKQGQ